MSEESSGGTENKAKAEGRGTSGLQSPINAQII